MRRSWRLNSNHYGTMHGQNKDQVRAQYDAWRRQYDCAPPPVPDDGPYSQFADPRSAAIAPEARPRTESFGT